MSSGLYFRADQLPERYRKQIEAKTAAKKPKSADDMMRMMGFPVVSQEAHKTDQEASVIKKDVRVAIKEQRVVEVPFDARKLKENEPKNLRAYKMTEPEKKFNRDFLHGRGIFEPITLRLPGGSRYTPDFLALDGDIPVLVECKGGHRLESEGRAHTAFVEAAANYSTIFRFVWAVLEKGGKWNIKMVIPADIEKSEKS